MNYLYAPISRQTFKRNPPVIAIFSPLFVLVALYQLIIILFPSFSIAIGIKISICFDIFPILPNFPRFSLNIFFLSLSPLLKFCIIKRNWSIYNMVTNHSSVLNGSSAISLPFVIINFNQEKKKIPRLLTKLRQCYFTNHWKLRANFNRGREKNRETIEIQRITSMTNA